MELKYGLKITRAAKRGLAKVPKDYEKRIEQALLILCKNPLPPGSKKVLGTDYLRVRIGDFRIIYQIIEQKLLICVVRVAHRREVYRNL